MVLPEGCGHSCVRRPVQLLVSAGLDGGVQLKQRLRVNELSSCKKDSLSLRLKYLWALGERCTCCTVREAGAQEVTVCFE